jgi:putative oxidoreductase
MGILQTLTVYLGRILLSGIFLISALQEMLDWKSTEQYFLQSATRWMNSFQADEKMASFLADIFPLFPWFLLAAVVFKIVGSLLLILGCSVRLGATLLILFLIPATVVVHCFWALPPQEQSLELVMFMKNVSILGGLFVVLAFGRGKAASKSS